MPRPIFSPPPPPGGIRAFVCGSAAVLAAAVIAGAMAPREMAQLAADSSLPAAAADGNSTHLHHLHRLRQSVFDFFGARGGTAVNPTACGAWPVS